MIVEQTSRPSDTDKNKEKLFYESVLASSRFWET
jgi:hypothetical protein